MVDVKQLYPECQGEYGWETPYGYTPLVQAFATVLLRVDDKDCQGDSRLLYRNGIKFGLLIFGWGSCSGCDALQACNSYADLQAFADHLQSQIQWKTKTEMIHHFKTHDWEGDFSWHSEGTKVFVDLALSYLENTP